MRMQEGSLCPICESGKLRRVLKDLDFKYKGDVLTFANAKVLECEVCGESIFEEKSDQRTVEKALTDARRERDGLLLSDEIRAIRLSFGMTQTKFAEVLDVGEKNFARYETGSATQARTMDYLLRLLRDHPELLEEIPQKASRVGTAIRMHERKSSVILRVDGEVLEWFKSQGKGYQSRMYAVLKAYAKDQVSRSQHDDSLFDCLKEKGLLPQAHAERDSIVQRHSVWPIAV